MCVFACREWICTLCVLRNSQQWRDSSNMSKQAALNAPVSQYILVNTQTHIHTHTHTHTHTGFHFLSGLSIGVMVFILYKPYFLSPYSNPTHKPTPCRKLSAISDFQCTPFFVIYKLVSSRRPKKMSPQGQNLLVLRF